MRTRHVITILSIFALLGGIFALNSGPAIAAPVAQTNHLVNPDFEDGFAASGVANFWESWVIEGSPTFQQITSATDTRRVHSGSSAQMMTASNTNYRGGLQQTVFGLTAGKRYRFSIWAHAWASSGNDSTKSEGYTNLWLKIGIGNGKTYAADPNITWSGFQHYVDTYQQLQVEFVAADSTVTVFTYANPEVHLLHNDIYWDNASLVEVATVAPTSAASATSPPPTLGIRPTDFPLPTPDANGQLIYVVQPGDSLVHIATVACGETPECVEKIKQLNNLSGNVIFVGQRLVIGPLDGVTQPAAEESTAEQPAADQPAEGEAAAEQPAEGETVAETSGGESATEAPAGEPATEAPEAAAPGDGAICVTLYEDANGNGILDPGEGLIAGGGFGLYDTATSAELGTYATDGASEPYCFSELASGNFRVTSTVPEGYTATTRNDWDLTLAAGSTANLEFGAQFTGAVAQQATDEEGGGTRITTALLGAAGVIFLLLAAGVAGFLVLTRRRAAEE